MDSSAPWRRTLALLSLASLGWAFSFGLGAPLASLWLRDHGCREGAIGRNTSAYYLGVTAAAVLVPWLMRRANRACVLAGMLTDAFVTAAFPWVHGQLAWFLLRLAGGAGTALSLIPMETLVNHRSPPARRARHFAVYAVSVAAGIGLGNWAGLRLYQDTPRLAFALGGLVTLLASALVWWGLPARQAAAAETAGRFPLGQPATLLGLGTGWAQGFLEGCTIAFLSLYLCGLGFSQQAVSNLTGGLFVGVVLAQLPVAWLADALGRLRIVLVCHAVVLAGLAFTPFCVSPAGLAAWLFLLGACCGALYPLGLALLGERVPPDGLARANACYLACNCAGCMIGPWLTGHAIELFGPRAQFAVGAAAVLLVVAAWAALAAARWGRLTACGQRGEVENLSRDQAA
jgi:MFS family permease